MRSFNVGRSDDPWFRIGTLDVSTTIFVVGVGLLSMFMWAVEGPSHPISVRLVLLTDEVLRGQIWRLITWPIPNEPDIWTLLLLAVFFMLGSQLEAIMGRRVFTIYLAAVALVPAVVVTLADVVLNRSGGVFGLRFLELGVLVGFAARMPHARFWPGIPAWGVAGGIVALDLLQYLTPRDVLSMIMVLAVVGTSLVMIRSLGFADEVPWIPTVPLPASIGGPSRPATSRSTTRRKRRGKGRLSAVPAPEPLARRELSRIEEAEMDAILEQVSEQGLDSLTAAQRARLEDHSRRLRKRD